MSDPLPYGPKYLDNVLTVLIDAGCKAPTFACLYALHRATDWKTGATRGQLAHATLARLTGSSFDTVKRHMRALRSLGVVRIKSKGNDFDGGEGNTYQLAIPGLAPTPGAEKRGGVREAPGAEKHGGGREARTPGAEKHGPPVQRSTPKPPSSFQEEMRPAPSRGGMRPIGAAIAATDSAEPRTTTTKQEANELFWDRRWRELTRQTGDAVQALRLVDVERQETATRSA